MDLRWLLLCLVFVSQESTQIDIKGFDDTVLFNIDWTRKLPEDAFSGESMIVTSLHQEKYQCRLPNIPNREPKDVKYEGPSALGHIAPLFRKNTCSLRRESYWTYEVCHGRHIRQYHKERKDKKIKVQEHFLGKWDEPYLQKQLEYAINKDTVENSNIPVRKIDNIDLPYYEITMDNGTLCDLNNKLRKTKVLYVCYKDGKHEVYSVKEISTCVYEVIILSPLLCAHPKYKPKETEEHKIHCVPLKGSPKKPYNLATLEIESEHRRNSDIDSLRIIKVDSSDVQSFLLGKACLYGQTGWWRLEFCYGKFIEQYHIKENRRRVSFKLGLFDEDTHLKWIKQHPHKRPKPLQQRKQVSHFYSSGSLCETGKLRQTEVKLKCLENPPSPTMVVLDLLEPKHCKYILTIEAPLICDILSRADENGLIAAVE